MQKILLLVSRPKENLDNMSWHGLRDALRSRLEGRAQVEISALSQLSFVIQDREAAIIDTTQGYELADFDLVVFRIIGKRIDEAIAVAAYCRKMGISYVDEYVSDVGNTKLGCAFVRWEHDLPVPDVMFGPSDAMISLLTRFDFQPPFIVKEDTGRKGRNNFLVHSREAVADTMNARPEVTFIVQKFIPNDGDYRLVTFNGQVRLAILRKGAEDSHLNNISQQGTATLVPLAELDPAIAKLAIQAAALDKLQIAGVDVIVDKRTKTPYILEVNRAPQIGTGAFIDEKLTAYADALQELVQEKQ